MISMRVSSHPRGAEGVLRTLTVRYANDAELALALAEGQPRAAAAAWDRFAQVVRTLLWKALGPNDDVDDLVQEVFITVFRRAGDLRDPSALGSFLVGVTIRTARSELRRRRVRRWVALTPLGVLPDVEVPHVDVTGRAAIRKLYGILDELDADARLAFVLRHTEGLELTEIAEALGCSLATAKRRLAKANERVLVRAKRDPDLMDWVEAPATGAGEGDDAPASSKGDGDEG